MVVARAAGAEPPRVMDPSGPASEPDPEAILRPVTAHRGWAVDLTGYVQFDWVAYSQESRDEIDPSSGAPLNQEHFGIPRASLRADGHHGPFFGEIELEGFTTRATLPRVTQSQGVRLDTSWVGWHEGKLVEVIGGLFRAPFGTQTPTVPRDRPFLELPTMSRALFPGDSDVGVMARGEFGLLRWSLAVMNGAPVGDTQWKGADPTSSYDFIGRIGADVPLPYKMRVIAGVSALDGRGLHPGVAPTKDQIQWVDENMDGIVQTTELQVIPGQPGEPSQKFSRDALGADVAVHWCVCAIGNGYAFGEAVIAKNLDRGLVYADPIARSRDIRELGFTVGAVQEIGDHGLVGVRFDRYDADRDATEREGIDFVQTHQVFSTLAVMASARWTNMRVLLEYDHNRNPLGRDDAGMPSTVSADEITLRVQAGF
jgi:hypothetical protein